MAVHQLGVVKHAAVSVQMSLHNGRDLLLPRIVRFLLVRLYGVLGKYTSHGLMVLLSTCQISIATIPYVHSRF